MEIPSEILGLSHEQIGILVFLFVLMGATVGQTPWQFQNAWDAFRDGRDEEDGRRPR